MTRAFRTSSRRRRRVADGAVKRSRSSNTHSELCAPETLPSGLRLRTSKGRVNRRADKQRPADPLVPSQSLRETVRRKSSMSVKQPSLRGVTAWFVAVLMVVGFIFGAAGTLTAAAKRQDAAEQDKDKMEEKKDEKKEEKKDEKKGLPLKSGRKVEFTTDEGTWLSLDVSPDGKTIVFELVG